MSKTHSAIADDRRSQGARRAATRSVILAAARQEFATRGFDDAKTGRIASAAGVAEGTLFLHFKNKRGLLAGVMEGVFGDLLTGAQAILDEGHDPLTSLKLLTRHYLTVLEKEWAVARVFGTYGRYAAGEFGDEFHRSNRRYTSIFKDQIQKLMDEGRLANVTAPEVLRDMLFGSIEHFALRNFLSGHPYDIDLFFEEMWQVLFEGACGVSEGPPVSLAALDEKLDVVLARLAADRRSE